jgi:hypothetical protein
MSMQDHVASSVNDTGTDQKIDAQLTHPVSLSVHVRRTVTIYIPEGYKDAKEFLRDCQFEEEEITSRPVWQPIETAPKDGKRIQLMRVKMPKFPNLPDILWIKVGSWRAHFIDGYQEGWREDAIAAPGATVQFELSPSHWMPLPAPPVQL